MSMWIIWWALLFVAVFWSVILFANRRYDLKRRGVTVEPGVVMWRTKRGLNLIDRIAKVSEGGWRAFGSVAAVVGIFFMIVMFIGIALYAIVVIRGPEVVAPGVRLIIPGVTIPLWAPLIAIATLLVVHEVAHGIVLRAQKLRTKSVGGLLLVAIPGAFVEPDEKQLNRSSVPKRLRVFGAGSFANILFAFACVGLILLFLVPQPGVYVLSVVENSPAENVLWSGAAIREINGVHIIDKGDFHDFMENTQPGDNLNVLTDNGLVLIVAGVYPENENIGYMGVYTISATPRSRFVDPLFTMGVAVEELLRPQSVFHPYCYDAHVPWSVIEVLKWMFTLNMLIGLFNLLPAKPLDGGYLAAGLVEWKTSAKTARRVGRVLSILVLILLIINFAPMFFG